ncbi:sulfotransferase [Halovulum marinum]|uniref:sulfotransferase n=1 Tax=Halovulum marinum TaxID=2662447 RepID=UPI0012B19FE4|nr:sulfotransferase [Halovulum marinum]
MTIPDDRLDPAPAPIGKLVDLAEAASNERNWSEAIARWTACFAHPEAHPAPRWHAALGNALLASGQANRAVDVFEPARVRHPKAPEIALGLARAYTRAERWDDAAGVWAACIAEFPDRVRSDWRVNYAECLGHLERWAEAEEQTTLVVDTEPVRVAIMALHARCAQQRGDWPAALERWDRCIAAADDARPIWLMDRATALQAVGRSAEATAAFNLIRDSGRATCNETRRAFVQAMTRARRGDELAQAFTEGFLKDAPPDPSDLTAARGLITCNRVDDARRLFARLLPELHNAQGLVRSLNIVALAHDADERPALYRRIADRAHEMLAAEPTDVAPLHRARVGAAFGTRDIGLIRTAVADAEADDPAAAAPAREILRRIETPDDPAHRRGKVFCIGLSKTGTTSLSRALGMLGYASAHWANPYTWELLGERDLLLFDALADTPITWQFRQLEESFPDARFIFTSRPLEDWRRSWRKHMIRDLGVADFDGFKAMIESPDRVRYGERYRRIHRDLYGRYDDPDSAFLGLGEEIRAHFSGARADKLLEFDVFAGDGFNKLCGFLRRPIPKDPFPWSNAAHEKPRVVYATAS